MTEDADAVMRIFAAADKDGSGELDFDEMGKLFKTLGMKLTNDQHSALFKAIDTDGNGNISHEEFLAYLFASGTESKGDKSDKDTSKKFRQSISGEVNKIKSEVQMMKGLELLTKDDIGSLEDKFFEFGPQDGRVHADDVKAALEDDPIIKEKDIDDWFRNSMPNGRDWMSFKDWCMAVNRAVDGVVTSEEFIDIFAKFDVDGNGEVDEQEFVSAVKSFRCDDTDGDSDLKAMMNGLKNLAEDDIIQLFQSADTDGNGTIDACEFVKAIAFDDLDHFVFLESGPPDEE